MKKTNIYLLIGVVVMYVLYFLIGGIIGDVFAVIGFVWLLVFLTNILRRRKDEKHN